MSQVYQFCVTVQRDRLAFYLGCCRIFVNLSKILVALVIFTYNIKYQNTRLFLYGTTNQKRMSTSETQEIQEKIKIWKKRLAGDSNSNPLVDFRKNKKPVVDIVTDSSFLYTPLLSLSGRAIAISLMRQ